jgi:ABC-2 type transport system ATP-binding protein
MSDPIRTGKLTKHYHRTDAVNGLDLTVPSGSIYALIGPNGAGKTTTIKLLMNILRATSGIADVLGVDSRRLGPAERRRIGYCSENQRMPDWMTVDYFLRYLRPFYPKWDIALEDELVRQFDLPRHRKLRHLSRGMRMKAALASSLAYRPELIVLDEPFTGLDALVREELIGGLLERAEGTTILISSHDLADIESFASHVGYIDSGHLRFSEEMSALSGRFRQVEVTFDTTAAVPSTLPSGWTQLKTAGAVLRFIDTGFDEQRTAAEVHRLFPQARAVDYQPMGLREIFVALAISGREKAAA